MTSPQRIYKVTTSHAAEGTKPRLVRAPNQSQALRFVSADTLIAVVASQDDLVALVADGVKVESSSTVAEVAQPTA
jgi:hypothetical protein